MGLETLHADWASLLGQIADRFFFFSQPVLTSESASPVVVTLPRFTPSVRLLPSPSYVTSQPAPITIRSHNRKRRNSRNASNTHGLFRHDSRSTHSTQTHITGPCTNAHSKIAYYQKFVDEHSKNQLKQALVAYDRTLLVADNRRCEPKKFGGKGARSRFQKSYR